MNLTTEQAAAIAASDHDLALLARAGSGKTLVLTEIAARWLTEGGLKAEELVMITFTERAADEMRTRLSNRLPLSAEAIGRVALGTIHSFAARLLREFGSETDQTLTLWDEPRASVERHRAVQELMRHCLAEPAAAFRRLIEEWGLPRLQESLTAQLAMRWVLVHPLTTEAASPLWSQFQTLYEQAKEFYGRRKQEQGVCDFEDLEERALLLLQREKILKRAQQKFRGFLVDEYQDTGPLQHALLTQLYRPGQNRLVIVGDPHQSIYSFRGANVRFFEEATRRIQQAGGRHLALTANFRSSDRLVERLNQIFATIFGPEEHPMRGIRGAEQEPIMTLTLPPTRYLYERRQVEAEQVAERVQALICTGRRPQDIAILFRTRAAFPDYTKALGQKGIAVSIEGETPLLECQEIIDQLHLWKTWCQRGDRVAWLGLLRSPLAGISDETLWQNQRCDWNAAALAATPLSQGTPAQKKLWQDFAVWWRELHTLVAHLKPSELAQRVLLRLQHMITLSSQQKRHLEQWVAFLEGLEEAEAMTLMETLDLATELRIQQARIYAWEDEGLSHDGVRLMTVHAAKGLEFPCVVLADLAATLPAPHDWLLFDQRGGVGLKYRDPEAMGLKDSFVEDQHYVRIKTALLAEASGEARRLLYVACTRAGESLILPLSKPGKEPRATWNDWLYAALCPDA